VESIHQQSTVTCIVGRPWLGRETLLGLAKLTERFGFFLNNVIAVGLKQSRAKQYFEEMPTNERILGKGAVVLDVDMLLHSAYVGQRSEALLIIFRERASCSFLR